ncbi:MAG: TfoX/Sxy family protein [Pseudomonadota bacterium]
MAYDDELATRFRKMIEGVPGLSEKRMMGGVCFFLNGNMLGGADRVKSGERRFMFRVGKENTLKAEALPGGEAMIQGGRRMGGFYFVDAQKQPEAVIEAWVALAVGHALSLPVK